jgi:hypothetical protein
MHNTSDNNNALEQLFQTFSFVHGGLIERLTMMISFHVLCSFLRLLLVLNHQILTRCHWLSILNGFDTDHCASAQSSQADEKFFRK